MNKNSFLTFIFSLIPGAGEMYLGYLKRGLSLMALFFALCFMSSVVSTIAIMLPVIWFYSFFDVIHIKDKLKNNIQVEDGLLISVDNFKLPEKKGRILGIILVVFGTVGIYDGLIKDTLIDLVENIPVLYRLVYNIPTITVCILLIIFGVQLIRNKKKENKDV